ncbi:hypothetical protein MPER_10552 [Moniliophthora perniciosa FA553]|nr:hypothetical protein MPER_10552 [Moniliophthora perniciosa FA553]
MFSLRVGSIHIVRTDLGIIKVLAAFTFPVGLVMIVLTGQELLTSNMMVMPMAAIKGAIPWWSIPLNWLIVTFGNLVGSLFFAAILVRYSGIVSAEPYHTSIQMFAIHKAADPEWHQISLRGMGVNGWYAWQSGLVFLCQDDSGKGFLTDGHGPRGNKAEGA